MDPVADRLHQLGVRLGLAAVLVGILAVSVAGRQSTMAFFSDGEVSSSNTFRTGQWTTATPTSTPTGTVTPSPTSTPTPVVATVELKPDSLQKKSKGSPTTVFIELPAGYDVAEIDVGTLRLCLGTDLCSDGVAAEGKPKVGDADGDGIPDLKVTFDRAEVILLVEDVPAPNVVTFTVSGLVAAYLFAGQDDIWLVDPSGDPEDTPTPTPNPGAGFQPTGTATETAISTATPTGTPVPSGAATGTPAPIGTETGTSVAPTGTATSTGTATATATGIPTLPPAAPSPTQTASPTATRTVEPSATPPRTPGPAATATATLLPATPTATRTATVAPTTPPTRTPTPSAITCSPCAGSLPRPT